MSRWRTVLAWACLGLFGTSAAHSAGAQQIGVSMARSGDTFLGLLHSGIASRAAELDGVTLQILDAGNDHDRQIRQILELIDAGADALIVTAVDTDATVVISVAARQAGVPLIYVNRAPINLDTLPDRQVFVASDEVVSGTLQTQEVCRLLRARRATTVAAAAAGRAPPANVLVMMGELASETTRVRTQDIYDVIATPECGFMTVVAEQSANWSREQAETVMADWLASGIAFDAVIANNDEMALGAINALKAAEYPLQEVIIAGIDATEDALAAVRAGDLALTVFQPAAGQGAGAVDAAMALIAGQQLDRVIFLPFELVTPREVDRYITD